VGVLILSFFVDLMNIKVLVHCKLIESSLKQSMKKKEKMYDEKIKEKWMKKKREINSQCWILV